jgi:hypothetical protein
MWQLWDIVIWDINGSLGIQKTSKAVNMQKSLHFCLKCGSPGLHSELIYTQSLKFVRWILILLVHIRSEWTWKGLVKSNQQISGHIQPAQQIVIYSLNVYLMPGIELSNL